MTRWARTNNRVDRTESRNEATSEEATPWSVMVQSLHASKQREHNPEEIEEERPIKRRTVRHDIIEPENTATNEDTELEDTTIFKNGSYQTEEEEKTEPQVPAVVIDKLARRILRNEKRRKQNANAPERSKDKNSKEYYFNEELETRYRVYHPYLSIGKFAGYQVLATGAKRLRNLTKILRKKGTPEEEVQQIIKLERRKEEHKLRRAKNKVCLCCRDIGHTVSQCPKLAADGESGYGICFRCGSTEHAARKCKAKLPEGSPQYPYAKCYICNETGHLAQGCPQNTKGVYPRGGSCHRCGSIEHLKGQCPAAKRSQINGDSVEEEEDNSFSVGMTGISNSDAVEELDEEMPS
jgi:zinc finger CCHC domain-containing protein 9